MRRRIFIILAFSITFMFLISSLILATQPAVIWETEKLTPISIPLFVYRKQQYGVMLAEAESIAQRFFSNIGTTFKYRTINNGRLLYISSADFSANLDIDLKTGAIVFNAGMTKYSGEGTTPNLPSISEAPLQAKEHLAAYGLLPKYPKEMIVAHIGGLNMSSLKKDGSTVHYDKLRTVRFNRVLREIPVRGPGSRIIVKLGERGELAGLVWDWAEVKATPVDMSSLRTIQSLNEKLIKRLQMVSEGASSVIIKKISLVLFDDDYGVIEPAYYVVAIRIYEQQVVNGAEISDSMGRLEAPYDFYLPVLDTSMARFPDNNECPSPSSATEEDPKFSDSTGDNNDE